MHTLVRAPRRRRRGLSLVELLVTIAVIGVLTGIAVPSFAAMVQSAQLGSASSAFVSSLRLARSQAIKSSSRVALCKSADGRQCATSGGWEAGWLVFHDPDADGQVSEGETVIQRMDALATGVVMTGNQPVARVITFTGSGVPRTAAGGLLAGTVTLCHRSADAGPAHRIVLASGGRPRVQKATVEQCG